MTDDTTIVANAATIAKLVDDGDHNDASAPRALGFNVGAINEDHSLVLMGSKAVIVKERAAGPIEDRVQLLTIDAFQAWFSNKFTEIVAPDGKIKTITWGRAWTAHRDRRSFPGVEFFPNPDGAKGTDGYLNFWRGFSVEPSTEGTYKIFRDHLFNNVCAGDEKLFAYVFGWFAHMVQSPRERIGTALVLRGRMGSGKTKVGEVFGSLISAHYFQVDDPRYITGQFNAHMAKCLLLQAEEAVWAGDKQAEGRLKGLITSECQMIESKGIDPIRIRNYVRLLMTSNEDWVVPAGKDERRFCVLDVDPRCAQDHGYFSEMEEELDSGGRARLLHDLLAFDLTKVNLREAPRTAALFEQKLRSLDPIESWWFDRLMEGAPTRGREEWPPEIATDTLYRDYLHAAEEIGVKRKRDKATFGLKIAKLAVGIERTRPRIETEGGQIRRVWSYALPSLSNCRDAFERLMGQPISWPASPPERQGLGGVNVASDEIPV